MCIDARRFYCHPLRGQEIGIWRVVILDHSFAFYSYQNTKINLSLVICIFPDIVFACIEKQICARTRSI